MVLFEQLLAGTGKFVLDFTTAAGRLIPEALAEMGWSVMHADAVVE